MVKSVYESYIPHHKEAAVDFIEYIKLNRNKDGCLKDVFYHLTKFSIDGKFSSPCVQNIFIYTLIFNNQYIFTAISLVSPGIRIKSLNSNVSECFVEVSNKFMDGLYKSLQEPPVWKIYKTNAYRNLESSHTVCKKY